MDLLQTMGIDSSKASISWDITPADTFGIFESWGGKERVRHKTERFYYFYIESWAKPAALCLMERGIKHARVLAKISAPQVMIDECIAAQGKSTTLDSSYAINDAIRKWLEENVLDSCDPDQIIPLIGEETENISDSRLASADTPLPELQSVSLRSEPLTFGDDAVNGIVRQGNFFDSTENTEGYSNNYLVDNGDHLTVTDRITNIMWMRGGCDINSIVTMVNWVATLNREKFAGYSDWRLPTVEEGLTLLEKEKNDRGLYIRPCFSAAQPFIFTADQRDPGGHWFIDFTRARVYWASGFNPGGFGRVCRSA
jgi:hypothetical protein